MLSADVARCNGDYCSLRHCCLRYTTPPVPDHPRQVFIGSPQTFDKEVECEAFMPDPQVSKRKIKKLKEIWKSED